MVVFAVFESGDGLEWELGSLWASEEDAQKEADFVRFEEGSHARVEPVRVNPSSSPAPVPACSSCGNLCSHPSACPAPAQCPHLA